MTPPYPGAPVSPDLATFDDLPNELLLEVFSYLSVAQQLSARSVCRRWWDLLCDQTQLNDVALLFEDDLRQAVEIFSQSAVQYQHIKMKKYPLTEMSISLKILKCYSDTDADKGPEKLFYNLDVYLNGGQSLAHFWDHVGPFLRSLSFIDCDIREKQFTEILMKCPNLKKLYMSDCSGLFMCGTLLESNVDISTMTIISLNQLEELSIVNNRYLSDALLNRFLLLAPNHTHLDLSRCQISFHPAIYRRFYPNRDDFPSESILTFQNLLISLKRNTNMTSINLSHTNLDTKSLVELLSIPGLKLERLHVRKCDQLTHKGLLQIADLQPQIKDLDISLINRVNDQVLEYFSTRMTHLENFNISGCKVLSDRGMFHLSKIKSLSSLDICRLDSVTSEGVFLGLCSSPRPKMRKLKMVAVSADEETVIALARNMPNLRFLDVSSCSFGITDRSIQFIFYYLTKLRTLKMAWCDKITDVGLTGQGFDAECFPFYCSYETADQENNCPCNEGKPSSSRESSVDQDSDDNQASGGSTPDENSNKTFPSKSKMSLKGKFESEILEDHIRKNMVQQRIMNAERGSGVTIGNLRGLRLLDLYRCNKITDVSLRYALHFNELESLNLSLCQQVTDDGLLALGAFNPSLQTLFLTQCANISDCGMFGLVKCLLRLKYLDIQGCHRLTDRTLSAIHSHCPELKHLDVSVCEKMTMEGVDDLEAKLPCLKSVQKRGIPPKLPINQRFLWSY